jgi:hypothetical protein
MEKQRKAGLLDRGGGRAGHRVSKKPGVKSLKKQGIDKTLPIECARKQQCRLTSSNGMLPGPWLSLALM